MKKILLAFLIFFAATYAKVFAQCGDIVLTNVSLVDTANWQGNATLFFSLTNISTDTVFVDSVKVKVLVLNHGVLPDQVNTTNLSFNPGQSYQFSNTLNLLPVAFQVGDNVVVIWPIINTSPCDSAIEIIYLKNNVGINDPELNSKLFITSLTNNEFQIHNLTQSAISFSRIFDLNGKMIEEYAGEKKEFHLNGFSTGIYLLEVKLADGKRGVFKLFVQ